ncbi:MULTISPECIES: sulfotransferase family 2 domain-containing protein [unclassified Pseudomonas]|uniref:sulfotransferase family 2 domain-containing protein n=1 Tax=unclassified Pseudomonas TaxID=196821 RepID=UPI002AC9DA0F|nr:MULTISPECIES: sulfotransferase family 2 domain-containing protein [unclassified Pseudomonas]MEB0044869.1 sulfotransferase family 2 domain-containing protein [Pseudomonas sp. Dout3]MEB0096164.1 sulfotransferase family 2 domain-containing protein [Pseudomonas sp. DC1.2]WPX59433.1 sulfotransferase family 2 domain-containing protein [Pseudomonas sp. DC1.2]
MLQRYLWKLLPKSQRAFLLDRLSVVDRQAVNKSLSANVRFAQAFKQHECLFIHVPKCAGSSVCEALFDGWRPGHLPLYWYEHQFPEQYAASFKFAFVRDPLERAYSAYAFLRSNKLGSRDQAAQKLVSHYRDFDDFVARWLHPETIHRQLHFAAQTDFLTDSLGHLALDFMGYHEHLERDFAHVCEQLRHPVVLPHINSSQHRHAELARDFCTVRTRRLVRRVYQRDYEMLGYE